MNIILGGEEGLEVDYASSIQSTNMHSTLHTASKSTKRIYTWNKKKLFTYFRGCRTDPKRPSITSKPKYNFAEQFWDTTLVTDEVY